MKCRHVCRQLFPQTCLETLAFENLDQVVCKVHGVTRDVDISINTCGNKPVDNVLQVSNDMLNIQPNDRLKLHEEEHLLVRVVARPGLQ